MKDRSAKRLIVLFPVLGLAALMGASCAVDSSGMGEPSSGSGTLKLLITDKPFPVNLLEKAEVTVVRVDVRRAGEDDDGDVVGCVEDADCDDGTACNGMEVCMDSECAAGEPPECEAGQVCDEVRAGCADACATDPDCTDDQFCNGDEVCDPGTGQCFAGAEVECPDDQACDENLDECAPAEEEDDDASEDGSPFITIFEGSRPFDLLDLQNGRTDLLADVELPAGTYTQVRVYVSDSHLRVVDVDREFVLKVPSGAQSGIKLNFTFEVNEDETTQLLLDVDLSRAFKVIPGGRIDTPEDIREFKFQPSLAMRLINLLEAGSVTGMVVTAVESVNVPVGDALVTAYDEQGADVTSTISEDSGSFVLIGLITGTYRLEVEAAGFAPAELNDVSVTAGDTVDVGEVVLTP